MSDLISTLHSSLHNILHFTSITPNLLPTLLSALHCLTKSVDRCINDGVFANDQQLSTNAVFHTLCKIINNDEFLSILNDKGDQSDTTDYHFNEKTPDYTSIATHIVYLSINILGSIIYTSDHDVCISHDILESFVHTIMVIFTAFAEYVQFPQSFDGIPVFQQQNEKTPEYHLQLLLHHHQQQKQKQQITGSLVFQYDTLPDSDDEHEYADEIKKQNCTIVADNDRGLLKLHKLYSAQEDDEDSENINLYSETIDLLTIMFYLITYQREKLFFCPIYSTIIFLCSNTTNYYLLTPTTRFYTIILINNIKSDLLQILRFNIAKEHLHLSLLSASNSHIQQQSLINVPHPDDSEDEQRKYYEALLLQQYSSLAEKGTKNGDHLSSEDDDGLIHVNLLSLLQIIRVLIQYIIFYGYDGEETHIILSCTLSLYFLRYFEEVIDLINQYNQNAKVGDNLEFQQNTIYVTYNTMTLLQLLYTMTRDDIKVLKSISTTSSAQKSHFYQLYYANEESKTSVLKQIKNIYDLLMNYKRIVKTYQKDCGDMFSTFPLPTTETQLRQAENDLDQPAVSTSLKNPISDVHNI